MVGIPWTWDDRAKAALSLFLKGSGDQSMKEYFRQLSWNQETENIPSLVDRLIPLEKRKEQPYIDDPMSTVCLAFYFINRITKASVWKS